MAVAREAKDSQVGQSVKPGINDAYRQPDLDVETWVNRFESESREIFKHRRRIVDSLGIQPGMVLGDIGAGTGLFTPLFSEAVGPTGKVLAVDITPAFLELIRTRARELRLRNVQTVLCDEDSTRLSPGSIDMAFVCDTYHHFEYPKATLASIHRALKPGGRLIVIDFERVPDKSREWIIDHVRAGREVVTAEIVAAGFAVDDDQRDDSYLEENYILRFRKIE
jgi:ubiquinone/menaquinone biosynthesis C-methylase UbiE